MRRVALRFIVALVLASCFLAWSSSARADDPKEVVARGIQAMGGEENIAKLKAMRATAKGTVNLGAEVPFTWVITWQSPDQYKMAAEMQVGDKKVPLIQGFDGTNGWAGTTDSIGSLEGNGLDELLSQMHLRRILMLKPLLTEKAFGLYEVNAPEANKKSRSKIRVTSPGERDVFLTFDNSTGLLSKIERTVFDQTKVMDVPQEEVLSNYKDVNGVKTPMKEVWFRSGVKVADFEYTEVAYPDAIDASEFARPATRRSEFPATRIADVIYGRKFGMALTMDVFTPRSGANGAAIILVVSGGWVSDSEALNRQLLGNFITEPVKRGYTVFAVFHGSQPKFTIPEVVADVNRAVRFIRHHAAIYKIAPDRIGITGGSAGGHLSLMQGTAGDMGNSQSNDPVERVSSRVQAVACLFPPTDFLNYGGDGKFAFGLDGTLAAFRGAMDVREFDAKTFRLERPADENKYRELAAKASPISHVSADDPPTLIIHGDADKLVPIQQAELMIAKLQSVGVRSEFVVRKGRGHDFNGVDKDIQAMTDWFDEHLRAK